MNPSMIEKIPENKILEIKVALDHYNHTLKLDGIKFEIPLSWEDLVDHGFKNLFTIPCRERIAKTIQEIMKDDLDFLKELHNIHKKVIVDKCIYHIHDIIRLKVMRRELSEPEAEKMKQDMATFAPETLSNICSKIYNAPPSSALYIDFSLPNELNEEENSNMSGTQI